jgi:hypothetical protein
MAIRYRRLSYYPWFDAEPDAPPPQPVPHPRRAADLPAKDLSDLRALQNMRPPGWTFLWTWPRRESLLSPL